MQSASGHGIFRRNDFSISLVQPSVRIAALLTFQLSHFPTFPLSVFRFPFGCFPLWAKLHSCRMYGTKIYMNLTQILLISLKFQIRCFIDIHFVSDLCGFLFHRKCGTMENNRPPRHISARLLTGSCREKTEWKEMSVWLHFAVRPENNRNRISFNL